MVGAQPRRRRDEPPDEALLRAVYEEHGQAMLAYASRLVRDRHAAADVVQETFLRAWRHPEVLVRGHGPILPTGTVTVRLTRAAFDDAIRARAAGLVETISRALGGVPAAAGLRAVVLTGGCTQIPLLRRLLGRAASGPLAVARFAAARGAAILAAPALSDAPAGTAR